MPSVFVARLVSNRNSTSHVQQSILTAYSLPTFDTFWVSTVRPKLYVFLVAMLGLPIRVQREARSIPRHHTQSFQQLLPTGTSKLRDDCRRIRYH